MRNLLLKSYPDPSLSFRQQGGECTMNDTPGFEFIFDQLSRMQRRKEAIKPK